MKRSETARISRWDQAKGTVASLTTTPTLRTQSRRLEAEDDGYGKEKAVNEFVTHDEFVIFIAFNYYV